MEDHQKSWLFKMRKKRISVIEVGVDDDSRPVLYFRYKGMNYMGVAKSEVE